MKAALKNNAKKMVKQFAGKEILGRI